MHIGESRGKTFLAKWWTVWEIFRLHSRIPTSERARVNEIGIFELHQLIATTDKSGYKNKVSEMLSPQPETIKFKVICARRISEKFEFYYKNSSVFISAYLDNQSAKHKERRRRESIKLMLPNSTRKQIFSLRYVVVFMLYMFLLHVNKDNKLCRSRAREEYKFRLSWFFIDSTSRLIVSVLYSASGAIKSRLYLAMRNL